MSATAEGYGRLDDPALPLRLAAQFGGVCDATFEALVGATPAEGWRRLRVVATEFTAAARLATRAAAVGLWPAPRIVTPDGWWFQFAVQPDDVRCGRTEFDNTGEPLSLTDIAPWSHPMFADCHAAGHLSVWKRTGSPAGDPVRFLQVDRFDGLFPEHLFRTLLGK